jgi:hypothetical protein
MIRRELNPEVRTLDEAAGIVEYVASDQTIDAQNEVVRADGWRFDRFQRNAPLVDSHRYGSILCVLGKIIDFRIVGRQLVETAQWAIDVPENEAARVGYAMTKAGYLKAVSVGFAPELVLTQLPQDGWPEDWAGARVLPASSRPGRPLWAQQMSELGCEARQPSTVFVVQQQLELSACVLGCNPNALAKSYKAGLLSDAQLDWISTERSKRETASMAEESAAVMLARQRKRQAFLDAVETTIKSL